MFLLFVAIGRKKNDSKSRSKNTGSKSKKVDTGQPNLYTFEIVQEFPHDRTAYTQGLEFEEKCDKNGCRDILWESTGIYGKSEIREVDLNSGEILRQRSLPSSDFGEGLTRHEDRLIQLTWRSGKTWNYAADDFTDRKQMKTPLKDGWGITSNGTHLWVGDSTENLYVLDPITLKILDKITVNDDMGSVPVPWLNELEWIDGLIYANVYTTECIAQINPKTGGVVGWVSLKGLKDRTLASLPENVPKTGREAPEVLNGIAFDLKHGRLFVTGKLWPKIYQIRLRPMYTHFDRHKVEAMNQEMRRDCIINTKTKGVGKL